MPHGFQLADAVNWRLFRAYLDALTSLLAGGHVGWLDWFIYSWSAGKRHWRVRLIPSGRKRRWIVREALNNWAKPNEAMMPQKLSAGWGGEIAVVQSFLFVLSFLRLNPWLSLKLTMFSNSYDTLACWAGSVNQSLLNWGNWTLKTNCLAPM